MRNSSVFVTVEDLFNQQQGSSWFPARKRGTEGLLPAMPITLAVLAGNIALVVPMTLTAFWCLPEG